MDTFCGLVYFFYIGVDKGPQHRVSTTVDGSLMWTLLTRPLGVHIRGTLLYYVLCILMPFV